MYRSRSGVRRTRSFRDYYPIYKILIKLCDNPMPPTVDEVSEYTQVLMFNIDKAFEQHTALTISAKHGHIDIIKHLFELNVDVNATTLADDTPLMIACHYNQIKAIDLLLERGVEINLVNIYGYTALEEASKHCDLDIVKRLLDKGADPTIPFGSGITIKELAIQNKNDIFIKLLEEYDL